MVIHFLYTALTEHHLKYLLEDTFDAQVKWYYIGLCLDLPPPKLDAMREDMNSSQERYTEVIKQWLKTGEATMRKLIDALESKTVSENRIVLHLRKKYAKRITSKTGIISIEFIGIGLLILISAVSSKEPVAMTSHPTVAAKETEVGSESEEGDEVPADREEGQGERESESELHSPPPVTSE